ncbi:MAG: hypothetical protein ACLUIO_07905 [Neglectibacter timonensis]
MFKNIVLDMGTVLSVSAGKARADRRGMSLSRRYACKRPRRL